MPSSRLAAAVLLAAACNAPPEPPPPTPASTAASAASTTPPAGEAPRASASGLPAPLPSAAPAASTPAPAASASAAPASECGEGMALIGKSCVDAYEAHLVIEKEDGTTEPWPHHKRPPAELKYAARSAAGFFPQGYISRVEAAKACKNAGKRLCSLGEWRRACQGRRWMMYGYGNKRQAGHCSSGKDHLLSKLYGSNGRAWKYDEHFNNPELNQLPGFLARSGDHPRCTAGEGVYDMVGNLHEWVSDTLDDGLIERLEKDRVERRKQPMREGNGLFLGGFFSTTSELGPGCMYVTAAHEPSYHDYSTGFRCCKAAPSAPEPPPKKKKKKSEPG